MRENLSCSQGYVPICAWELEKLLYNTEAVVVKTVRYGETHMIATLLTPTGRVSAMAKNALKPQSRLAAGVRLCAEGIYFIYQGKGMGNIQQVEITTSRRLLHSDLESAAYAAYFCELLLSVAEDRPHGSPAMYRQFTALLDILMERRSEAEIFALAWETKICSWLGVGPDWRCCVRCGDMLGIDVRYSVISGGCICPRCQDPESSGKGSFQIPGRLPKILYLFERTAINQLGKVEISPGTKDALQRVLTYQLSEFGGLYLKSRSVLNQMKRVFDVKEEDDATDPRNLRGL